MIVNIELSTKHLHKFLYKTKMHLEKMFSKISSIHKRLFWSMHANIKSDVQHHTTAKDKNLSMCYKNIILGEKNSIASSHSSKLSSVH